MWTVYQEGDKWFARLGEDTEIIGPFDTRPDLEAALIKRGVGHQDIRR